MIIFISITLAALALWHLFKFIREMHWTLQEIKKMEDEGLEEGDFIWWR